MYNAHRGIPPPGPTGPPPSSRLAELLDQVRQEFDVQGGRTSDYEHQREYSTSDFPHHNQLAGSKGRAYSARPPRTQSIGRMHSNQTP